MNCHRNSGNGWEQMRVNSVINNNRTAWQEVSRYWNDQKSRDFNIVVCQEMEAILNRLDGACERLEAGTESALARLSRLENI